MKNMLVYVRKTYFHLVVAASIHCIIKKLTYVWFGLSSQKEIDQWHCLFDSC